MSKSFTITKRDFDNLLLWFAADRVEAGEKYEEIHAGLVRFFQIRGCADPLALTDETLNRVAKKLPTDKIARDKVPIQYIYGFALNVYREYLRLDIKHEVQLDTSLPLNQLKTLKVEDNERKDLFCLEKCLEKTSAEDKEIIFNYYGEEKNAKADIRKKMAENLNISMKGLHTKVHRIKNNLRKCIKNCINKKNL